MSNRTRRSRGAQDDPQTSTVAGGLGLDGQEHDNGLSAYGNSAGQSRLPPQQQDEGGLLGWLDEGDEEEDA